MFSGLSAVVNKLIVLLISPFLLLFHNRDHAQFDLRNNQCKYKDLCAAMKQTNEIY